MYPVCNTYLLLFVYLYVYIHGVYDQSLVKRMAFMILMCIQASLVKVLFTIFVFF